MNVCGLNELGKGASREPAEVGLLHSTTSIPPAGVSGPPRPPVCSPWEPLALECTTVRRQSPRGRGTEPWEGLWNAFGELSKKSLWLTLGLGLWGRKPTVTTPVFTSPNPPSLPMPSSSVHYSSPLPHLTSKPDSGKGETEAMSQRRWGNGSREQPLPPFRRRMVRPELPNERKYPFLLGLGNWGCRYGYLQPRVILPVTPRGA